jgi:XisI protein
MDTQTPSLKQAILSVLQDYIDFLGNDPNPQLQQIVDKTNNHYLLLELWIQQDGTEDGIASELVQRGIPKDQIVLGFKSIERRKITEFAAS